MGKGRLVALYQQFCIKLGRLDHRRRRRRRRNLGSVECDQLLRRCLDPRILGSRLGLRRSLRGLRRGRLGLRLRLRLHALLENSLNVLARPDEVSLDELRLGQEDDAAHIEKSGLHLALLIAQNPVSLAVVVELRDLVLEVEAAASGDVAGRAAIKNILSALGGQGKSSHVLVLSVCVA